jgi:general stress protein 26
VSTNNFDDIGAEFHRRVAKTIWCTLATVDTRDRARTRIVHPVWNGPHGWLGVRAGTPKLAHIARRPSVSLMYWDPDHEQVTIDATAYVASDASERHAAWAAMAAPEPPYGYDPTLIFPDGPDSDDFVAVELVAYRVTLFGQPSLVWETARS